MKRRLLFKCSRILCVLLAVAVAMSILFPSQTKKIVSSNIDLENGTLDMINIYDDESVEMRYPVQEEGLFGVILYFTVNKDEKSVNDLYSQENMTEEEDEYTTEKNETEKESEKISEGAEVIVEETEAFVPKECIEYIVLDKNDDVVSQGRIDVTEVLRQANENSLTGTELKFDMPVCKGQVLRILLSGDNLEKNTKVTVLGNKNSDSELVVVRDGIKYPNYPLYQMESGTKEFRYTWDLVLVFFIVLSIMILSKENEKETD